MKIAIISDHIPYFCAHSINIMKHSQGFFDLGHKIEVLTVQRFIEEKNRLKIKDLHDFYDINYKIKIRYFRDYSILYFKEIKFLQNFSYIIATGLRRFLPRIEEILDPELKICKYCKKKKIDLVYVRRTYRTAINNILNKIPTFIELHNFEIKNPDLLKLLKLSKKQYFKGLITISKILQKKFIEFGVPKKKILVLEDAVDLNKFNSINIEKKTLRRKLNLPSDKKIIFHLGKLSLGRGINIILDSAKLLENEGFSYYFLGGEKNEIKKWKRYKTNRNIKTNITFLGFKKNKIIPLYLKSADILLAPYSLKCETANWMSPIKIFEYMGSKVPFIASDLKRLREICNNNECLFFRTNNALDLSEKIRNLIENQELQQNLTNNAYLKAKNNTYIERCKKIIEFIN